MTAEPGGVRRIGKEAGRKISLVSAEAREHGGNGAHFAALNVQANVFFRTGRSMICTGVAVACCPSASDDEADEDEGSVDQMQSLVDEAPRTCEASVERVSERLDTRRGKTHERRIVIEIAVK